MRKLLFFMALGYLPYAHAQTENIYFNNAESILQSNSKLSIGGYGEVHYNQPIDKDIRKNGLLDAHRMVMFLGYNFDKKTQFVTEIEFEYAKELWVEQMFLQHKLNDVINFRAGLLLIPMGIINEYHEPSTFNGVERPTIDNLIAPSTWREIGFGITGKIDNLFTKYQLYVVNGPLSYTTTGDMPLTGEKGLREGRQKGSKSMISSPNFTGKVEYYGISGLNLGLSGYTGKSQSALYNNLKRDDVQLANRADSTVVGINMLGLDGRYNKKGFELRGQFYFTQISNSNAYNTFATKKGKKTDLGSSLTGFYVEGAYNVLRTVEKTDYRLLPFVRYQQYDTQNAMAVGTKNNKNKAKIITTGLTLFLSKGTVLKTDIDFVKTGLDTEYSKTINAGIGFMF